MNEKLKITLTIPLIIAFGCTTASVRMMPGDDGIHKVSARDEEKHIAEEAAFDAAKDYCNDEEKKTVFLSDETVYDGAMDEGTRQIIRGISSAASKLGRSKKRGSRYRKGKRSTNLLGGVGKAGASVTSDKDYLSVVTFKCK